MSLENVKKNQIVQKNRTNKYFLNYNNINWDTDLDSHVLIAKMVKEGSVVLDVGCAQGLIGTYLKKEKKCKVYGIEIDDVSRNLAEKSESFEEIFNFPVGDWNNQNYQIFLQNQIQFDYIIFADVLEHLFDPAQILYEFQKNLKPNGSILVSIPNTAHLDIIYELMNDQFNYAQVGLLDNTHIRFFTENSFAQMIDDINEYYHCHLDLILFGSTLEKFKEEKNYPVLNELMHSNCHIDTLQYIFEIKKINENELPENLNIILGKKTQNLFSKIEEQLNERNQLIRELDQTQKILSDIYNSKGYNILNKIYKVKDKLHKKDN